VTFLLGCSFTFDTALVNAGIDVPHMRTGSGQNVPMFVTNIPTKPAGQFHGPLVVSMRAVPREKVVKAVQVTSRYPTMHGTPVHIGDPAAIGIKDAGKPDYGTPVGIGPQDVTMFWACGVTPGLEAAVHNLARARPHVHHRRPRRRYGGNLGGSNAQSS